MRSDSILNTGLSSVSVNKVAIEQKAREDRARARDEKRTTLAPVAQIITEEFNKERERAKLELLGIIDAKTPEKDVKAIIASLNLYATSMNNLQFRLINLMKLRGSDE